MKKLWSLLSVLCVYGVVLAISDEHVVFDAKKTGITTKPLKMVLLVNHDDPFVHKSMQCLKDDLEFTDQLTVDVKAASRQLERDELKKLFNRGVSLYGYVERDRRHHNKFSVVVKDAAMGKKLFRHRFVPAQSSISMAHEVAASLLPKLTGEAAVTKTQLAYCTLYPTKKKSICIADYLGREEREVVPAKAIHVVPCWHSSEPQLFYSQITKKNTRLMVTDLDKGKHFIVSSFEGLNMQPSVSPDGNRMVMCLSRGNNSELYLYDMAEQKRSGTRVLRQLTKNGGTNVSPTLLDNGDVIFCSDFQTGSPQVYYLESANKTIKRLTRGGYCAKPSYCAKSHSIVYTKPVNGTFQLFRLSLDEQNNPTKNEQLTFNTGDKHTPTCSPDEKYVAFSYRCPNKHGRYGTQIAVLNTLSGKIRVLTSGDNPKSFPAWRPVVQT